MLKSFGEKDGEVLECRLLVLSKGFQFDSGWYRAGAIP